MEPAEGLKSTLEEESGTAGLGMDIIIINNNNNNNDHNNDN